MKSLYMAQHGIAEHRHTELHTHASDLPIHWHGRRDVVLPPNITEA